MRELFERFFGARPHGDSLLTARLEDAFAYAGCPVCRLVAETTRRGLEALLYENVNDPGTHRVLLASRGYCTEHTWALVPASEAVHSRIGVAILFERLLADLLRQRERVERVSRWLQPAAPCPACVTNRATADAYLAELGRLCGVAPGRVTDQPGALCLPHLRQSASYVDGVVGDKLAAATATALEHAAPRTRLALRVGYRPLGTLPARIACPACRAASAASAALPAMMVLCRRHAWVLFDRGRCELADTVQRQVSEQACPVCQAAAMAVAGAVASLTDGTGLCLAHARLALQRERPLLASLVRDLTRLDTALARLRESADYRFTGTLTADERGAWSAVLARFGGESVGAAVTQALPFAVEPAGADYANRPASAFRSSGRPATRK